MFRLHPNSALKISQRSIQVSNNRKFSQNIFWGRVCVQFVQTNVWEEIQEIFTNFALALWQSYCLSTNCKPSRSSFVRVLFVCLLFDNGFVCMCVCACTLLRRFFFFFFFKLLFFWTFLSVLTSFYHHYRRGKKKERKHTHKATSSTDPDLTFQGEIRPGVSVQCLHNPLGTSGLLEVIIWSNTHKNIRNCCIVHSVSPLCLFLHNVDDVVLVVYYTHFCWGKRKGKVEEDEVEKEKKR